MLRLLGSALLALAPSCVLASALAITVKGEVYLDGAALREGARLARQSTLITGAGAQARLRFDDGMEVVVEERSELRVVDFQHGRGGQDRVVLDLLAGAARFVTGAIAQSNPKQFFVRTPQASLGVLGGSDFSVVVATGTYVSVSRGTVIAANHAATVSLEAGPTAGIPSAGATPNLAPAVPAPVTAALARLGAGPVPAAASQQPPPAAASQQPVPAAASQQPPPAEAPATALGAPRFFFGASAGASKIDEGLTSGLLTSGTVDGKGTGFKLFGGYYFHRNFGAEVAFVDLGEAKYEGVFLGAAVTGGKLTVRGINLAALGRLALSERFDAFAKIGSFIWEAEATDTMAGEAFTTKTDGANPSFGVGASFRLTRTFSLRAEGEVFRVDKENASLLSLGALLTF